MSGTGERYRSAGRFGVRGQVVAFLAILGSMGSRAGAQIDVNETGLRDGAAVYGLESPLIENSQDVTLFAWGATEPHPYLDVSFHAYGIFSTMNPMNSGEIAVTATGGSAATSGDFAAANILFAGGIYATGNANNARTITVAATAGTADSSSAGAFASVHEAAGVVAAGDIYNTGDATITATGGTAGAADDAIAYSYAVGLESQQSADNTGTLRIMAIGGSATADGHSAAASTTATAYGIDSDANIVNGGLITATALGGIATAEIPSDDPTATAYADTSAEAYGLLAQSNASNSGDITAAATGGSGAASTGGDAHARVKGIFAVSSVDNSGSITASAAGGTADANDAADAHAEAFGIEATTATNTGALSVEAWAGDATSASGNAYAHATAYGVVASGANVDNTAAISVATRGGSVSADGNTDASSIASGMFVENGGVDNSADIVVTSIGGTAVTTGEDQYVATDAYAYARGIAAAVMLSNSGDVTVTVTAGTATGNYAPQANAAADGLRTFGSLTNSGDVTVTATGGTATGPDVSAAVDVKGLSGAGIVNAGAIAVVATGGTATATDVADSSVYAAGISGSTLINTGAVSVIATAGTTDGSDNRGDVFAVGVTAGGNVHNSAAVTVAAQTAAGSSSQAYGIRMNSNANIFNSGIIRVTGDTTYELSVASGTTTLVDTYNVTLDGDPDRASIGVADEARLALNDATLTVTALPGTTLWDTEYRLFETEGTGVVDGNFADARAVNPNTTATYYDQGTAGAADDTVSLAYIPAASPGLGSALVERQMVSQATQVVNRHMTAVLMQSVLSPSSSGLLASTGWKPESLALAETASAKDASLFVEPYYSRLDREADPLGYDATLWGFTAGFERQFENTLLALHLGYGQSDIDFRGAGYNANSEDQDVVTAGVTALNHWEPWTLRYGLTGFYGGHDYRGLTGLSLDERETASYESYGLAATLMGGRILRRGTHVFLPEAGLNWLWSHRRRYTTEATDPAWDTTYAATDDHDLYAAASLRWLTSFMRDGIQISPSAAIGVRHLLTDAEVGAWQSIEGAAPVLVRSEQDRTAMTLSGSLILTRARHAVTLAYDGDYAPDTRQHSLWLRYSLLF